MNDKKLNLLILEDNPDDAELMVRELKKEGVVFKWKRVETEKEFKKALSEKPDIILADYKLPSFDGMTAIKLQQQIASEIPLILVSGSIGEELAVECLKAGASDCILKDKLSRLSPVVKHALKGAEEHRERKNAEEKEKEHYKNIELLSEIAMQFVELPKDKDIYNFIGEQLHKFVGKNSYVIVNSIDTDKNILTTRAVIGMGKLSEKVVHLFGRHPVGVTYNPKEKDIIYLSDGKLHLYEEGLYEISLKTIPKIVCNSIEKLLNVKRMFTIGFIKDNELFGNLGIFSKESSGELKNKQIIEAFIKQASIAIQKRQTEEALKESEEKYKTLYDSSRDAIMILTMEQGYIGGNLASVKMFKCKDEKEFISKNPWDLSSEYQPDGTSSLIKAQEMLKIAMEKGSHFFDWKHKRIDGEEFFTNVLLTKIELSGKIVLQATVRDITERKQAEMEIHLLHKLTKAISEASDFKMALSTALSLTCKHTGWVMGEAWIPNHDETALEYHLGYYDDSNEHNKRLSHFIQLSKEYTFSPGTGLPGRVWQSMQPEWRHDISGLSEEIYLRAKPSKKTGLKAALGVPIISNGKVLTVLVFYMTTPQQEDERLINIVSTVATQLGTVILRKQAEVVIRKSNERFQDIATTTGDWIWEVDKEGRYTYCSPVVKQVLGYMPDELLGKHFYDFFHPDERDELKKAALIVFQKKQKFYDLINRNVHKDGRVIFLETNAVPLLDDKENLLGYRGVDRDITKRKQAEEDLKKALEKATESDRLKSAFLSTISHELRTPLNAIIGFSEIIDEDVPNEEIIDYVKMINRSGHNLFEIIEDILEVTDIESGSSEISKTEFRVISIFDEIVENIESIQENEDKKHLEIKLNFPADAKDLMIISNKSKIKKVLIHLLKNAFKFTEKGYIEYGLKPEKDKIIFYVKDTGVGIPENKQNIIFDKFRQADDSHTRKFGGMGIGLTLVKKIMELLGGEIWFDSFEGKGTTFYFSIPIIAKETEVKTDIKKIGKDLTGKTILVAEDEDSNFMLLEKLLGLEKINTIRAVNGKEAVEKFKEFKEIDLILMDIKMPVMNGYEATNEIRKVSDVPIIALSAYTAIEDKEEVQNSGCNDFIEKPIKRTVLLEKIVKLVNA